MRRYLRLMRAFARFTLLNEMAFRANFLVKISVELIWLGLLLIFYDTVFRLTSAIEGWNHAQFLIFLGIYYSLEGVIETFFLENCNEFSDLVRKGDLDIYLLKPIDERFLELRLERARAFEERNRRSIRWLQRAGLADPALDAELAADAL